MLYEIYLVTNLVNNKRYVGQTHRGYMKRFNGHIEEAHRNNRKQPYFHLALLKYGEENFRIELIESDIPEKLIDERERYWIKYYNTYYLDGKGYNLTRGGQGIHGYKFDDDIKKKVSDSVHKFWEKFKLERPDEYQKYCEKMSRKGLGRKFSSEHKKKLSDIAKTRVGELNPFYGKHHSEETKQKIRQGKTKKIGMFDLNGNLVAEFESLTDAGRYILEQGLCKSMCCIARISKICRGIDKTAYGYI